MNALIENYTHIYHKTNTCMHMQKMLFFIGKLFKRIADIIYEYEDNNNLIYTYDYNKISRNKKIIIMVIINIIDISRQYHHVVKNLHK